MQDRKTLAQYISFARDNFNPVLTEDAARALVAAYGDMRRMGNNRKTITATPRQLESLIRLAESIAKMRFSESVEEKDVAQAVQLMRNALRTAATDPRTGLIDLDLITTGQSMAARHQVMDIARAVMDYAQRKRVKTILFNTLLADVRKTSDLVGGGLFSSVWC